MFLTKQQINAARAVTVAIVATVSLGACATYKDEFASINSRLDQLDVKVQQLANLNKREQASCAASVDALAPLRYRQFIRMKRAHAALMNGRR